MASICVFCGSSPGNNERYIEAARELGSALVHRGFGLVYGGVMTGLMGAIAETVMADGGEVVGIIPKDMLSREIAKRDITDLRVVESMHERKQMMSELSDAFVALPGGMGTFEELCEILTWAQLGIHHKPVGVINASDYYDPLLALFDHAVTEGFIAPSHRMLLKSGATADELLDSFDI
ncbi:MAG: TIGR00730 family Rossman fold protein [Actinomycetota bacterium]